MANRSLPDPFDHSNRREYSRNDFSNEIRNMLFEVRPAAEGTQNMQKKSFFIPTIVDALMMNSIQNDLPMMMHSESTP